MEAVRVRLLLLRNSRLCGLCCISGYVMCASHLKYVYHTIYVRDRASHSTAGNERLAHSHVVSEPAEGRSRSSVLGRHRARSHIWASRALRLLCCDGTKFGF